MPKHCMFAIILSFLFSTSLLAATGPLPDDPNLDKPVTLAIKGEVLSDIAEMLGKQSGAQLRVNKDISGIKATIFVDKMPLRDVMIGLETLFRFHWSVVKKGGKSTYELWETPKAREERIAGWDKAYSDAWNKLDSRLKLMASYAAKSPEELRSIKKNIDEKLKLGTQPGKITELTQNEIDAHSIIMESYYDPSLVFVINGTDLLLYKSLLPEAFNALKSGYTVCINSASAEPEWRIPDDITAQLRKGYKASDDTQYGAKIYSRLSGDTLNMHVHTLSGTKFGMGGSGGYVTIGEDVHITEPTIPDYLPHAKLPEILTKKFSITGDELVKETGIGPLVDKFGLYANKSDILALIHSKLGTQVIADHYSFWSYIDLQQEFSAIERINTNDPPSGYCGWDGKFLYMRTAASHSLDASEIPTSLLSHWQEVFARQGYLGLQELAEIATSLSDEQINALKKNAVFLKLAKSEKESGNLGKWDTYSKGDPKICALRLYYTLSEKQRKQALSGGTSVSGFNQNQRAALADYQDILDIPDRSAAGDLIFPVGIYKKGIRIDKPMPPSPSDPISIELKAPSPYKLVTSNGSRHELQGESVNDAFKQLNNQNTLAKEKGHYVIPIKGSLLYPNKGVEVVIKFADGYTTETEIDVLGEAIILQDSMSN